ncbi:hypothetical protein [Carboxydothermus hydrogenoformans]|nr:hypothetical protein [Carboxydothermus hydrogenoformans]
MLLKKDLMATFLGSLAFLATFVAEYFHIAPRVIGIGVGFLVLFCSNFLGKRQAFLYVLILTILAVLFLNPIVALKYFLLYLLMPLLLAIGDGKLSLKILTLIIGSGGIFLYLLAYLKYFKFIYILSYKINSIGYLIVIAIFGAAVYYLILTYGWTYIRKNIPANFLNYLSNILD